LRKRFVSGNSRKRRPFTSFGTLSAFSNRVHGIERCPQGRSFSILWVQLLDMQELEMRNLNSLVTRLVARAFHAFVQGRLRAELPDSEIDLNPSSTDSAVEKKPAPKRQRQTRESQAAPFHWAECSRAELPTIGVL